jgi:glycosyltransferase involved in cell wall biosynthesis
VPPGGVAKDNRSTLAPNGALEALKSVMRAAIVHYWLLNMRGGERVVEALCRLIPDADVFTLFYDPEKVSPLIRSRVVKASFLNPFRRYYRSLLPLAPIALEAFDLRGYDLVVSSESGPAKGVITSSNTQHICYCHSPMRYLWDLYPNYLHEWTTSTAKRAAIASCATFLRLWDSGVAAHVDEFVANSRNVQRRIWKAYRRSSDVVYPPVDVRQFFWRPASDYYLIVSELVSYKRVEDAVRCFSQSGRRLKIVGDGPDYRPLKKMAAANVEFCGRVPAAEISELYARCRALLMPGEEDFGIVAVEAMASGKPVIALGRGGILESTPGGEPFAAVLYEQPGAAPLEEAVRRFEKNESSTPHKQLQEWAAGFSEARFAKEMGSRLFGSAAEIPQAHAEPAGDWMRQ